MSDRAVGSRVRHRMDLHTAAPPVPRSGTKSASDAKQIAQQAAGVVCPGQLLTHDGSHRRLGAVGDHLHRVDQLLAAGSQTLGTFRSRAARPSPGGLAVVFNWLLMLASIRCSSCSISSTNSALRFSHLACDDSSDSGCKVRAAKRACRWVSLDFTERFRRSSSRHPRVDHRPLGLRNLLRAVLVKQINGKVLHHVAEEVFLGPSTEQSNRILAAPIRRKPC